LTPFAPAWSVVCIARFVARRNGHALLERLGDDFGDELRLELGTLHFVQRQVTRRARDLLQILLELLDAHALAADEDARDARCR
jgi:hypothetical protein